MKNPNLAESLTRGKRIVASVLRDILIFAVFFGTYSGLKQVSRGYSKAKILIQEQFSEQKKESTEGDRKTPRTRAEISRTA